MQNTLRKSIWWRSPYKTSLSRQYKHGFKKKGKIGKFAKGIIHDFGQKVEVFSCFVFMKNRSRKSVADILDKKEAFKDFRNNCLWQTQN